MGPIQIYHEAPLSIFDKVQDVTDGDYALVHLLHSNVDYANKFPQSKGRPLILDNSAYELGESFDAGVMADWVEALQPDIYIVPDSIGSTENTIDAFDHWKTQYPDLPGKKMGVVQGNTVEQVLKCFELLGSMGADIIGVPFLIGRNFGPARTGNYDLMARRVSLLERIHNECDPHPIHLLGVALPQEGKYSAKFPWIQSIDTSNPVMHGLFRTRYGYNGIDEKRTELLADLINDEVTAEQETDVFYNIRKFKEMWAR